MHYHLTAPHFPIHANVISPFSFSLPRNADPNNCPLFASNFHKTQIFSVLNCRGIEAATLPRCSNAVKCANGLTKREGKTRVDVKDIDVATLGNLCVDIVLNVTRLPPAPKAERKAYMERLSASPPDKKYWEAGGNCNTAIAAARLGLCCTALGYVGNDIYGNFLLDVLQDEGVGIVGMSEEIDVVDGASAAYETLLCWVLVDPLQRHGFCSRADFSEEPAFSWMNGLTAEVKMAIRHSKILVVNGYGFDELSPGLILSALEYSFKVGTSVFFDPGPRGKSLSAGTPEEQMALSELLKMSDVLLLTSDEAESLTGIGNPIMAGKQLLKQGVRTKWVIVKMGSKGSIMITLSSISCAPAFKVNALDTVGCGDSFVAAIAYGFVHQMPMVHTLAIANAVGAATAMGSGAGRNVATWQQVMEIIKTGDLNENYRFWNEMLDGNLEVQEMTLLSKTAVNGYNDRLNHLSYEKVAPELRSKLESAGIAGSVAT